MKESVNLKLVNKKIIILSAIVLVLVFILSIIFVLNVNNDFIITKTIWGELFSNVNKDIPGTETVFFIALFVSGLSFLGELGLMLIVIFLFFIFPVFISVLVLLINAIAGLFQIGESRKWKNIISKILLYFAVFLHGILNLYLLILALSGFGLIYIFIYLILLISVFVFIKKIMLLKRLNI